MVSTLRIVWNVEYEDKETLFEFTGYPQKFT